MMKWIPCSERLPREYSDDERVLATTDVDGLGVILIPIYDVVSWYRKGYISAWMPLPKPYEAEWWCLGYAPIEDEPQTDCKECEYVWWNSEAKRYECSIEKCPYSQTERSSE